MKSPSSSSSSSSGLLVSVDLLHNNVNNNNNSSLSLLESARAAAKTRLERGLLCTRTRIKRTGAGSSTAGTASSNNSNAESGVVGLNTSGSSQDMTHLLDNSNTPTIRRNDDNNNGDDNNSNALRGRQIRAKSAPEDTNYTASSTTTNNNSPVISNINENYVSGEVAEGAEQLQQPMKSQALEPAPVYLIDATELISENNKSSGSSGPTTWFSDPYVHVLMTACGDMEDLRKIRPKLKMILDQAALQENNVSNNDSESSAVTNDNRNDGYDYSKGHAPMLIVYVIPPCTESVARTQRRIFERLRDEANVKRGVMCCR